AGDGHPVSREVDAPRDGSGALPDRSRAIELQREDAALGRSLAARQSGSLSGPRLHLRSRPAEWHAASIDATNRSLRVLSIMVARRKVDRVHDVERRDVRIGARRAGKGW